MSPELFPPLDALKGLALVGLAAFVVGVIVWANIAAREHIRTLSREQLDQMVQDCIDNCEDPGDYIREMRRREAGL